MAAPSSHGAAYEEDEALGKAYDHRLMRRFLSFLLPHRGLVTIVLLIVLCGTAVEVAGPFIVRAALDGPIAQKDYDLLWVYGALAFAVALMSGLYRYVQQYITGLAGQRILYDLRTQTYAHLQKAPVSYFDRNPVGRLLVRITNDIETLTELFSSGLVALFSDIMLIFALMAAMFYIEWRMTLVTLCIVPLMLGVSIVFRKFMRTAYRKTRWAIARVNAYLGESVGGVKTIQIFNREQTCLDRFEERNKTHREMAKRAITAFSLFWPTVEFLAQAALAGIIVFAARWITAGTVTIGDFISFWWCVQKFFQPVRELAEKYNILQAAMASSERVFSVLDTPLEIEAPAEPADPPRRGEIEFQNVSFSYDGKTPVLKDVSFRIRPGEKVALVGYTAAGKTTIISLLLRLYDVDSGKVLVDGVDVREYDPQELRRRFGLVLQDVFLFAGSVTENMRLGEDIPMERIEEAAKVVKVDRIIEQLPQGYDTPVRERGSALSTGERQLLSFGRALAFDPPILVLDEATSSVDAETEGLIQDAMARVQQNRTSLVVAHRLSTVKEA
ncbi:MAG: ABC transporter ATP-binding protein, partial [Planctomycetota bacterium]